MGKYIFTIAGLVLFAQALQAEMPPPAPPKGVETETSVKPVQQQGSVARSAFTLGIQRSEPQDNLLTLGNRHQKVYYFTELVNLTGQKVIHRWEFAGSVMAEVPFEVKGSHWRVWSSKNLLPGWLGEWKVSVVDAQGNVLGSDSFKYTNEN